MWGVTSPWPTRVRPGAVNPVRTLRGTSLSLRARPSFSHCTRCLRFRQASVSGLMYAHVHVRVLVAVPVYVHVHVHVHA